MPHTCARLTKIELQSYGNDSTALKIAQLVGMSRERYMSAWLSNFWRTPYVTLIHMPFDCHHVICTGFLIRLSSQTTSEHASYNMLQLVSKLVHWGLMQYHYYVHKNCYLLTVCYILYPCLMWFGLSRFDSAREQCSPSAAATIPHNSIWILSETICLLTVMRLRHTMTAAITKSMCIHKGLHKPPLPK